MSAARGTFRSSPLRAPLRVFRRFLPHEVDRVIKELVESAPVLAAARALVAATPVAPDARFTVTIVRRRRKSLLPPPPPLPRAAPAMTL